MNKRSKWKLPYVDFNILKRLPSYKAQEKISTTSRSSTVLPNFVHKSFLIHNGKKFQRLKVEGKMIGHKLGEFAATRAKYEFKKKRKKSKK